jgi:glycosyltransferase involved in cell wall biosynthesis
MARIKLGLIGFGKKKWASLERTRSFYLSTLQQRFETTTYFTSIARAELDAVLSFSGKSAWLLSQDRKFPLILSLHGGAVIDQDLLCKYLPRLKTSDALIVNSSSDVAILKDLISPYYRPIIQRLSLPVDTHQFTSIGRARARKALPFDVGDCVVGYVGRLVPQKNLHQFLRMFSELKRRVFPKSITAIIIGDFWQDYPILNFYNGDAYRDYIVNLIRDLDLERNIRYLRMRRNDTVLALCYNAMDILLHPTNSIDENFGYAPVEAMACGTPVVGAAYGGLKDTIVSGHTGFLMPTWATSSGIRMDIIKGTDDAFRILTDAGLRAFLSKNAITHIKSNYANWKSSDLLCRAVQMAIERVKGKRESTLRLRKLTSRTPLHVPSLPKANPTWEVFLPPVERYVSHSIPKVRPNTYIQLTAPLWNVTPRNVSLDDPAWPATFALPNIPPRALVNCNTRILVRDFMEQSDVSLDLIQECINMGLFVAQHDN